MFQLILEHDGGRLVHYARTAVRHTSIHYRLRNHHLEFTVTADIPALIGLLSIDWGEISSTDTAGGTQ